MLPFDDAKPIIIRFLLSIICFGDIFWIVLCCFAVLSSTILYPLAL